jgi:hypothetical protein
MQQEGFVVQPQYGLINMRVGLERANSCHVTMVFRPARTNFFTG